ncbi:MAG: hypothetical protein EA411_03925 [Saprospirales bacterium]|nr:MAG: hypothetical protein EA411_03925 [Saprospirales bacterium]
MNFFITFLKWINCSEIYMIGFKNVEVDVHCQFYGGMKLAYKSIVCQCPYLPVLMPVRLLSGY